MGYDQNNEYYNSGDQGWRDQTNVYQTQREQPTFLYEYRIVD